MAGVMMSGDEGKEIGTQSVPSIGGNATIVATEHVGAAEVSYPESAMTGNAGKLAEGLVHPYTGTAMSDATPNDPIN